MPDHENTGSGRQGGSLLSHGGGAGSRISGGQTGSILSATEEWDQDQALRHRLARSRREARPSPLLHALAAKPDSSEESLADIDKDVATDLETDFDAHEEIRRRSERTRGRERLATDYDEEFDYNSIRGQRGEFQRETDGYDNPRPLIDPLKVAGGVMRSKRLIAATTIAGALIGVMVALSTPKKYEAVGEILIDPRNIKLVDRELISSDVSQNTAIAIVENHVRVMTSGAVMAKVVERLNLDNDPEFNGSSSGFGFRTIISELRALISRSDSSSGSGRNHAIAVQNLLENLEVSRSGKTFVVTVGVKSHNPDKSALIANTVVDVFMDYSDASFSSTASRVADELGAKLDELRNAVEDAERKVEAFRGENDLVDARGHLIGDDDIIRVNDQLAIARAKTIELSAKAASARSLDPDSVLGGALPEGVSSGLITELRSQYAELLRQANQVSVKFGAKHPESRAITAQLEGAREQVRSELRRIVASMQIELKRAVQLEQKLASRLAELKARQANVSDDMVTLRELERDAAAKRAVYESYLLRARETGEQKDLNSANMSVISPASPPLEPVGPSRSMISITGMVAGFLLGIGLGGLRGATEGMFGGTPPGAPRPRSRPPLPGGSTGESRRNTSGRTYDRYRDGGEASGAVAPPATAHMTDSTADAPQPPAYAQPGPSIAFSPPAAPPWPAIAQYPPYWPYGAHPVAPAVPPYGMAVMPHPPYPGMAMPGHWYPPAQHGAPTPAEPQPEAMRETARERLDNRSPERRPRNRVEAIRDDLREVKSAIHDLAARRSRRRG